MTRAVTAWAVSLVLLAGGGVLAGCSGSDNASSGDDRTTTANGIEKLPPTEILTKSAAAMATASSVAVSRSSKDDGPEMSLDLVLGTGVGRGTMSLNGTTLMEFRETGGKMYWKTTREGFESIVGPGDASKLLGGRWVVAPVGATDGEVPGPGEFGDKDALLAPLIQEGAKATVKGTGEVDGTPVVFVKTSGSDGTATLAIQTVGEPYVVQVRSDGMVLFDFSDWNAPVNVTAPAGAVSPADLMKEVGPSS